MDGKSLDITQDKLNRLRELFPDVFSEDRVDWEKLKAALGEWAFLEILDPWNIKNIIRNFLLNYSQKIRGLENVDPA